MNQLNLYYDLDLKIFLMIFIYFQEFKQILKSLHVQVALHLLFNHPPFYLMNLKPTIEMQVGIIYLG